MNAIKSSQEIFLSLVEKYCPKTKVVFRENIVLDIRHINGLSVEIIYYADGIWRYKFRSDYGYAITKIHNKEDFLKMWGKIELFGNEWDSLLRTLCDDGRNITITPFTLMDVIEQEPYSSMVKVHTKTISIVSYTLLSLDLRFTVTSKNHILLDDFEIPVVATSVESLFPESLVRHYKLNQLI
jgi:hypothetical protein